MSIERQKILFSGVVQGVGFRYTARQIARAAGMAGFVRNLSDGRVELVLEGDPAAIARALSALEDQMAGYIDDTRVEQLPPSGQTGFEIR